MSVPNVLVILKFKFQRQAKYDVQMDTDPVGQPHEYFVRYVSCFPPRT